MLDRRLGDRIGIVSKSVHGIVSKSVRMTVSLRRSHSLAFLTNGSSSRKALTFSMVSKSGQKRICRQLPMDLPLSGSIMGPPYSFAKEGVGSAALSVVANARNCSSARFLKRAIPSAGHLITGSTLTRIAVPHD